MFDYLKENGKYTFNQQHFNLVDNIVFSYIIYTNLKTVFSNRSVCTIKQAADIFFENNNIEKLYENRSLINRSPFVLQQAANTNRYKDILIHHYVNIFNSNDTEQFSACCFDIDEKTTYVSFCGTDDTLVGWKEDFQISYEITNAQNEAVKYLNDIYDSNKNYIIGGHSKGGNLAIYAACKVSLEFKDHIIQVISNDGPGLSEYSFNQQEFDTIKDRYLKIIPEFDFIGMIYYRPNRTIIVKSSEFMVMQHDVTSWQINDTLLVSTSKASHISSKFKKAIDVFVDETTIDQRKLLTDSVFDAFKQANINNLSDLIKKPSLIKEVLPKSLDDLDDNTKEIGKKVLELIKEAINDNINQTRTKTRQAIKNTFIQEKEKIDKLFKKV